MILPQHSRETPKYLNVYILKFKMKMHRSQLFSFILVVLLFLIQVSAQDLPNFEGQNFQAEEEAKNS